MRHSCWVRSRLRIAFLLCSLLSPVAGAGGIQQAARANDVERLEQLAQAKGADAGLARAMALSLRRQDILALTALEHEAQPDAGLEQRVMALQELAALHMRNNRFRAAHDALAASAALKPLDAVAAQTFAFLQALLEVAPMRAEPGARGQLPLRRDAAGLARVEASIEGQVQEVVIDSGAAFSTMTASTAKGLGLKLLETQAAVGSVSRQSVPTRFAIAHDLRLAEAVLHEVVFIVLPDEALSFAGGSYRIDAILGLPVFLQLKRMAVETGPGGHERLSLGEAAPAGDGPSNLIIKALEPLLLARSLADRRPLRLLIDTGARSSHLFHNAADEFPELLSAATMRSLTLGGAGGERTDSQARNLPHFTLWIGERRIELHDIALLSTPAEDRHGAIGQDVLRQGRGYVLDFEHMRLSLLH